MGRTSNNDRCWCEACRETYDTHNYDVVETTTPAPDDGVVTHKHYVGRCPKCGGHASSPRCMDASGLSYLHNLYASSSKAGWIDLRGHWFGCEAGQQAYLAGKICRTQNIEPVPTATDALFNAGYVRLENPISENDSVTFTYRSNHPRTDEQIKTISAMHSDENCYELAKG